MELSVGVHLDLRASIAHSQRLGCLVRESAFSPSLVVGIREGGILPARIIADDLGTEISYITVRRRISGVKHTNFFRFASKHVGAYLYKFPLMRRLMQTLNRVPGRSVAAKEIAAIITPEKKILLVDDFSCTGETFLTAIKWLQNMGVSMENIQTAALIAAPDPKKSPVFYPSYMLANVSWVFFPWSSNSPNYENYLSWKHSRSL